MWKSSRPLIGRCRAVGSFSNDNKPIFVVGATEPQLKRLVVQGVEIPSQALIDNPMVKPWRSMMRLEYQRFRRRAMLTAESDTLLVKFVSS